MKKTTFLWSSVGVLSAIAGSWLMACSSNNNNPAGTDSGTDATEADAGGGGLDSNTPVDTGVATDSGTRDAGGHDAADSGSPPPPPPTLGAQIDRFGRPAVNTALNHSFDSDASTAGAAKDMYNADNGVAGWSAAYRPEFEKNLAILASLDTTDAGSGCGLQLFANPEAGAARYATLAGVLADDRLWVNTAATTCSQYLGVELIATGILANDAGPGGGPTNECGGRKLGYDVIQTTYSAVALGATSGFGSGVSAVASKTNGTTFPYLAPPQ